VYINGKYKYPILNKEKQIIFFKPCGIVEVQRVLRICLTGACNLKLIVQSSKTINSAFKHNAIL